MKKFNLQNFVRPHIAALKPYSSARDEYAGKEGVFLDANENPAGSVSGGAYNRYPDPLQNALKEKLAVIKQVSTAQIFFGNGSDEAIDLLFRAFTQPGKDNVIILPPTYGMYEVSASINDIAVRKVPLTRDFQIDVAGVAAQIDAHTKMIFLCHPNNPTGNLMDQEAILAVLEQFEGLVVVDEAYIDFANATSNLSLLEEFSNLVVLQTFSKAWGLAALRLGVAYASRDIISILNKIKPPYNIGRFTQEAGLRALGQAEEKDQMVKEIIGQRTYLAENLLNLAIVRKVYPSDANFLLVQVTKAEEIYQYLLKNKIIVRDRSNVMLCEECLRVTVGTAEENKVLLKYLKAFTDN